MPELDDVIVATTNAGDHFSLALTGDWSTDISEAVTEEHGHCEDSSCDIREAAENGFPLCAAFLLQGATETPVISAVAEAYERAGIDPPEGESLGQGWPAAEWDAWKAHHDQWARKCHACGSYTFADANWEPDSCSNCLASLVEHFAIAVVFHVQTTRGAAHAWEELADDIDEGLLTANDDALFASSPLVLEDRDWQDPDFDVTVTAGRGPHATQTPLERAKED